MRISTILALVLCLTVTMVTPLARSGRTFFPFLNRLFGYSKCGSRACPPWKCQDDSAVIHGYCCKCPGSQFDNVPVPCYLDLKCPISSDSLCSDYNFMMDCCCSGS